MNYDIENYITEQAFTKAASDVVRAEESLASFASMLDLNDFEKRAGLEALAELLSKVKGGIVDAAETAKATTQNIPGAVETLNGNKGYFGRLLEAVKGNSAVTPEDAASLKALGIGGPIAGVGLGVGGTLGTQALLDKTAALVSQFDSLSLEKQANVINYLFN